MNLRATTKQEKFLQEMHDQEIKVDKYRGIFKVPVPKDNGMNDYDATDFSLNKLYFIMWTKRRVFYAPFTKIRSSPELNEFDFKLHKNPDQNKMANLEIERLITSVNPKTVVISLREQEGKRITVWDMEDNQETISMTVKDPYVIFFDAYGFPVVINENTVNFSF